MADGAEHNGQDEVLVAAQRQPAPTRGAAAANVPQPQRPVERARREQLACGCEQLVKVEQADRQERKRRSTPSRSGLQTARAVRPLMCPTAARRGRASPGAIRRRLGRPHRSHKLAVAADGHRRHSVLGAILLVTVRAHALPKINPPPSKQTYFARDKVPQLGLSVAGAAEDEAAVEGAVDGVDLEGVAVLKGGGVKETSAAAIRKCF